MGDRLECLAQARAARVRQRVMRTGVGHGRLAGKDLAQDREVFAGASKRLGVWLAVPTLDHLRPRGSDTEDVSTTRQVVERKCGHRGGRGSAR